MYDFSELLEITEREIADLPYPARPSGLYEPIRYTMQEGGKRIRPVLTLMACNLFCESIQAAKPAALAVEIFHNFTLLHDDMMDNSPTRRGKPAVHRQWNENTAILSGDMMLIYAYRLLEQSDESVLPQLLSDFNDFAAGVCEGQQYDMDFETRLDVTVDEYLDMIRLKTGVLLAGALKLGAICGGAADWQQDMLYQFGIKVGIAFQIQDDLLDTYGAEEDLGKPVGGDILNGKKNYLLSTALAKADGSTRQELLSVLEEKTVGAARKIAAVKSIYDRLDLKSETEQTVSRYFDEGDAALEALDVPAERLRPLRELSARLFHRNK